MPPKTKICPAPSLAALAPDNATGNRVIGRGDSADRINVARCVGRAGEIRARHRHRRDRHRPLAIIGNDRVFRSRAGWICRARTAKQQGVEPGLGNSKSGAGRAHGGFACRGEIVVRIKLKDGVACGGTDGTAEDVNSTGVAEQCAGIAATGGQAAARKPRGCTE